MSRPGNLDQKIEKISEKRTGN